MKPIYPESVDKILIRGPNWIGDAIMSLPALKEIRRVFPRARISLLVRPWVKDIYSAVDCVDEVVAYDKRGSHRGWLGFFRITSELRDQRFNLAILLQNALEAALIAWCAGIPQRVGYARDRRSIFLTHAVGIDPEIRKIHQIYYYLEILSSAGLLPPALWRDPQYRPCIRLRVRDAQREAARQLLVDRAIRPGDVVVGLNPGASYGSAKRWLTDRYASVADQLADRYDAKIVIIGSVHERPIAEQVARTMRNSAIILSGQTSLGQLMGLIEQFSLFITNDSGPMHLAAALDVPQLAIFGSTSEVATGPFSAQARVIKHPVECSPCFLRECPIDFRCMTRVSVEQVLQAAQEQLDRNQRIFKD